jgi:hypothetical protein
MKYLCMIFEDEQKLNDLSQRDWHALRRDTLDYMDLEEAIQLASKWPGATIGTIEVRPIEDGLSQDRRYDPAPTPTTTAPTR